jgi:HAE1 family hydrophobic/amphiphilic exporter-1/multidrug efflux pump
MVAQLPKRAALNQQNVELPSGKLTGNNTELTVKQLVICNS